MTEKQVYIDISRWQGLINWTCMKTQGVVWAAMRATLANYYVDDRYLFNAAGAKANGIMRPPYHVTRADKTILGKSNSALAQMDLFSGTIDGHHEGVVILDVELAHAYGTTNVKLPPAQVTDLNMACVDILESRYDAVLFYSRATFMNEFMQLDPRFSKLNLFLAEYGVDNGILQNLTRIPKGCDWDQVALQQYTSRGTSFCCESKALDFDVVRNRELFDQLHSGAIQPPVEEPIVEPPATPAWQVAIESRLYAIEKRLNEAQLKI